MIALRLSAEAVTALPDVDVQSAASCVLVTRAQAGDEAALEELCSRYLPRLRRWAHGRLPMWARTGALDTFDLVQDTMAQAVRHLPAFEQRHEAAFQAYLRQALMNRVRDEVRKSRRCPPADPIDSSKPSAMASPLEEAIGAEALERYETALQALKPTDREAIILRIELGLSCNEIASALGKPTAAAAHMTVTRALVRLVNAMTPASR